MGWVGLKLACVIEVSLSEWAPFTHVTQIDVCYIIIAVSDVEPSLPLEVWRADSLEK